MKTLSTKKLCGIAVLTAMSIVLVSLIHFPLLPAVPFLEYDAADVPIIIAAFLYGVPSALIMTVAVSLLQAFALGGNGVIGFVMHVLSTGGFVVIVGLFYKRKRTFKSALAGMGTGILFWIVEMTLWNVLITPLYMKVPREVIVKDFLGYIALFNLIKPTINCALTLLLYKNTHRLFDKVWAESHKEKGGKDMKLQSAPETEQEEKSEINPIPKVFLSKSVEDTYKLAETVAKNLTAGEVVLLDGDLGAGKTTFTKGLFKALGVTEMVTSPTFTIMNEYRGDRFKLYHFDMYRIESEEELSELGFEEQLFSDGVSVIEWNKISDLPEKRLYVSVKAVSDTEREFEINESTDI